MAFHVQLQRCLEHWEKRGLTRDDLARRIGCSKSAISHWTNDRRPIRPDLAREMFRVFAATLNSDVERQIIAALIELYGQKFPDRSTTGILEPIPNDPGRAHAAPREGDHVVEVTPITGETENSRSMATGFPGSERFRGAFALAIILAAVVLSQEIAGGATFLWSQVWSEGALQPLNLFLWTLLFSAVCLFAIGFDGEGAEKRAVWIERRAWRESYVSIVQNVLDTVDRATLPVSRSKDLPETSFWRNWSVVLYERMLALAILYPLLFLMVQWLLTGSEQSLGFLGGWPSDDLVVRRALIAGCFVSSVCIAFYAGRLGHRRTRQLLGGLALTINLAGYMACWIAYGGVQVGPGAINMATVAFILGMSFKLFDNVAVPAAAASVAGAALSFAFPLLLEASEFLTGRSGAGYGDLQVKAVHTILNHALNIMLFFLLAALFSRFLTKERLSGDSRFGAVVYLAVTVGTSGMMFVAATQGHWAEYYLFLGLIPILNAFFDFCSVGLTRYTLRLGVKNFGLLTIAYGILDCAIALSLFILLIFTGILLFDTVNTVNGSAIIPLGGDGLVCRSASGLANSTQVGTPVADAAGCVEPLLLQLHQDPSRFAWLLGAFATTLLPTIIHLGFAVFAFAPAVLGPTLTTGISRLSREARGDLLARLWASLAIGLWIALSVVVTSVVVAQVLSILFSPATIFTTLGLLITSLHS